jgi:hypothetical protein
MSDLSLIQQGENPSNEHHDLTSILNLQCLRRFATHIRPLKLLSLVHLPIRCDGFQSF